MVAQQLAMEPHTKTVLACVARLQQLAGSGGLVLAIQSLQAMVVSSIDLCDHRTRDTPLPWISNEVQDRLFEALVALYPTVGFANVRLPQWWRKHSGTLDIEALPHVPEPSMALRSLLPLDWALVESKVSLMIALAVLNVTLCAIIADTYLQTRGVQSALVTRAREAVTALGLMTIIPRIELRHLAGWAIAGVTSRLFEMAFTAQQARLRCKRKDDPLALVKVLQVSLQDPDITVEEMAYSLALTWDSSVGHAMSVTGHLAPTQALVLVIDRVMGFIVALELRVQHCIMTYEHVFKYGGALVTHAQDELINGAHAAMDNAWLALFATSWPALFPGIPQPTAQCRAVAHLLKLLVISKYLKSRSRTQRVQMDLLSNHARCLETRIKVRLQSSTTVRDVERAAGLPDRTLALVAAAYGLAPKEITTALGEGGVAWLSKVQRQKASTTEGRDADSEAEPLMGQYALLLSGEEDLSCITFAPIMSRLPRRRWGLGTRAHGGLREPSSQVLHGGWGARSR